MIYYQADHWGNSLWWLVYHSQLLSIHNNSVFLYFYGQNDWKTTIHRLIRYFLFKESFIQLSQQQYYPHVRYTCIPPSDTPHFMTIQRNRLELFQFPSKPEMSLVLWTLWDSSLLVCFHLIMQFTACRQRQDHLRQGFQAIRRFDRCILYPFTLWFQLEPQALHHVLLRYLVRTLQENGSHLCWFEVRLQFVALFASSNKYDSINFAKIDIDEVGDVASLENIEVYLHFLCRSPRVFLPSSCTSIRCSPVRYSSLSISNHPSLPVPLPITCILWLSMLWRVRSNVISSFVLFTNLFLFVYKRVCSVNKTIHNRKKTIWRYKKQLIDGSSASPFHLPLLHINRMSLLSCIHILLINLKRSNTKRYSLYLNGLISLTSNQASARLIKCRSKDRSISINGTRLKRGLFLIKAITTLPIVETQLSIIGASKEDIVLVERDGIENTLVTWNVIQKLTLERYNDCVHSYIRTLPAFDVVGTRRSEGVLTRNRRQARKLPYIGWNSRLRTAFLWWVRIVEVLISARSQRRIVVSMEPVITYVHEHGCRTRAYLRFGILGDDTKDGALVSSQSRNVGLGTNIPYTTHTITTSRKEDIQGRMQSQAIDTIQVFIVASNDLGISKERKMHVPCSFPDPSIW